MTRYEVLKSLVKKWRDTTQSDFLTGDYRYGIGTAANELEAALALPEDSIRPIDRDEEFDRTYIPLPGGWEVQTKGKGSTFRICDPSGRRLAIPPSPYLHETLERMAREIHSAMVRPVNGDSKTVNAELYGLAIELCDRYMRSEIESLCVNTGSTGFKLDARKPWYQDEVNEAVRYISLREASGEPMPYKVIREGGKVRFE